MIKAFSTFRSKVFFSRWSRKNYAIFNSLGKEVVICHLKSEVCAKADEKGYGNTFNLDSISFSEESISASGGGTDCLSIADEWSQFFIALNQFLIASPSFQIQPERSGRYQFREDQLSFINIFCSGLICPELFLYSFLYGRKDIGLMAYRSY